MLSNYFQWGTFPEHTMVGSYDGYLVLLSYLVAAFASYIALDMAGRLRDKDNTLAVNLWWLVGGAFAMGAGIWSMHFIGMLAFKLPMPMSFDPFWTIISMVVAILASLIALSLLMGQTILRIHLIFGGIVLGIAIAAMHYTGMYAMTDTMIIRYMPGIYALSIVIAIVAAEAALVLAIKSNQGILRIKIRLKLISALIMAAAICGMHYTGMAAAIFSPKPNVNHLLSTINPDMLAISIAGVTFLILGIAFGLSTYKEISNQQIITTARLAGMAEVSSNVLHSVGNVLNSLNTSASTLLEQIENSKMTSLTKLNELFQHNKDHLQEFLTTDPRGSQIPSYLKELTEYWENERKQFLVEILSTVKNISHIKEIISTQQSIGNLTKLEQTVDLPNIIQETITITGISLETHFIKINKEFHFSEPCVLDKVKLLQILVNLLRNAKDSLIASTNEEKVILIKLDCLENKTIVIQVIDNGLGISSENLKKIFTHGFTTKPTGHGFGLHSSAILATQMGGSLTGANLRTGRGAVFTLQLPYKKP